MLIAAHFGQVRSMPISGREFHLVHSGCHQRTVTESCLTSIHLSDEILELRAAKPDHHHDFLQRQTPPFQDNGASTLDLLRNSTRLHLLSPRPYSLHRFPGLFISNHYLLDHVTGQCISQVRDVGALWSSYSPGAISRVR